MKRAVDLVASLVLAVLLAPFTAVIAVAVRSTMGRPVLFKQPRLGWKGRQFTLYKFRTMTTATDEEGRLLPSRERITRLGGILRRSGLDEIPQLFNIIRGDLAFVGPRPLLVDYRELYSPEQARRHDVRPGLTGWAQVNGRSGLDWDQRFELDVWYVDNQSWRLDLRILGRTASTLLRGARGTDGSTVVASRFTGSREA